MAFRAGFINILGKPNAGKSTLLNALLGEKLAIISPKVQTTRHRILGILNRPEMQLVFSDTPGLIDPSYKLQERMMQVVHKAVEDADVVLWLMDATDSPEDNRKWLASLAIRAPQVLVINKIDRVKPERLQHIEKIFATDNLAGIATVSALQGTGLEELLVMLAGLLPESPPYYPEDMLTEKPVRFYVSELIREKIYQLYRDEIPYHSTVVVHQFQEKNTLTKIAADIVVQRDTQKGIILGEKGKGIKKLGELARKDIEAFIGRKVFLELHVKVRAKWRDKDIFLREYGYS
jgi:GTP-binding protein Era